MAKKKLRRYEVIETIGCSEIRIEGLMSPNGHVAWVRSKADLERATQLVEQANKFADMQEEGSE